MCFNQASGFCVSHEPDMQTFALFLANNGPFAASP